MLVNTELMVTVIHWNTFVHVCKTYCFKVFNYVQRVLLSDTNIARRSICARKRGFMCCV